METLRTELATEMGIQRLDSLLEMGRKSIEDVRGYLHQMESPCQSPSLIQSPKSWSRISGARSG